MQFTVENLALYIGLVAGLFTLFGISGFKDLKKLFPIKRAFHRMMSYRTEQAASGKEELSLYSTYIVFGISIYVAAMFIYPLITKISNEGLAIAVFWVIIISISLFLSVAWFSFCYYLIELKRTE